MALNISNLPVHIQKLLSPDFPHEFYVIVGDPKTDKCEKIGIVRPILMAISPVFMAMLEESQLRHEAEFNIPDVEPQTFKHFLVFCYFADSRILPTGTLEDLLKLLKLSDKYDVQPLKNELETILSPQVNTENVLLFLRYGPVVDKVPSVWNNVIKIIERDTDVVFAHPDFVKASQVEVECIIQQERLSVGEIDVWKAVLRWAQHQVSESEHTDAINTLRHVIMPLLKHIRFCSMTLDEMCTQVGPEKVLTYEEIGQICLSIGYKQSLTSANHVNNIKKRSPLLEENTEVLEFHYELCSHMIPNLHATSTVVFTNKSVIKIIKLDFWPDYIPLKKLIIRENIKHDPLAVITDEFENVSSHVINGTQGIVLQPNTIYVFKVELINSYTSFIPVVSSTVDTEYLSMRANTAFEKHEVSNAYCYSIIKAIHFKVVQ